MRMRRIRIWPRQFYHIAQHLSIRIYTYIPDYVKLATLAGARVASSAGRVNRYIYL